MKKIVGILLVLCVLLGSFALTLAEDAKVSVMGSGNVSVKADTVKINLGIRTRDKSAMKAIENNKELVSKLIKELEGFGIAKEDISTESYNINFWDEDKYREDGYEVNNSLTVKLRDISRLSEFIEFTGKHGVNSINGFMLESSQSKEAYLRATELAVENAREKAEKLAKLYNKTLGDVISVSENEYGWSGYSSKNSMLEEGRGSGEMIVSGDINVSVGVNVTFELK